MSSCPRLSPATGIMDYPPSPSMKSVSSVLSTPIEDSAQSIPLLSAWHAATPPSEFEEDPKFYFRESNVKLIVRMHVFITVLLRLILPQVGTRVYNVPRAPLERHSTFFRSLFSTTPDTNLPPGWVEQELDVAGQTIKVYLHGASNTVQTTRPSSTGPYCDAYPLYDIDAHEFGVFLSVLYPECVGFFLVLS